MVKKFFVVMLFLFSFSLVSSDGAHYDIDEGYIYKERITETKYFPGGDFTWSRTTYVDYDNDERFPTYDYRHGYTYRATTDYRDKHYRKKGVSTDYKKHSYRESYSYKDYDYKRISNMESYDKWGCYNVAPKNKLFYIECR